MRTPTAPTLIYALLFCCLYASSVPADAQAGVDRVVALQPPTVSIIRSLPNGVEVRTGTAILQVTALREDVLRVRMAAATQLPEDASWAVLDEARTASVAVQPKESHSAIGFKTAKLAVSINPEDGRLTVRDTAGNIVQQDAEPVRFDGTAFRIRKVMPADEHYFGLGDKTGPSDRRNHAYTMWNTDSYRFQESTDPIYKDIPFFMTFCAGTAVGVLLDNTWRSSFDFGKESPDYYTFGAVNGPVNYYVFLGPTPREVVETYAWLTGKAPLPPRWMLGFQQSRYSYTPEARLMEIGRRLRADRIPADALYMDIDYQDRNRPFAVDTARFPQLAQALTQLHAQHFHVVAITDLHIADAPNQGYAPFDSGRAGNQFLHRPDGSVYVGKVWPGPSVFPDFTRDASRAWWGSLYKTFAKMGFDGFWNDMNEPSVFDGPMGTMPLDVVHRIDGSGFNKRAESHAELHNVYGMENSRATYDGLLKIDPDVRPFVLTRASYAGGQRYAATWTGDDSSTWNHLRMTSPMLKSLGLSGFSFSGADVGGYAGTPSPELLTRWIEVAAFHPIDRDHTEKGTGDQEPWVGGVEQENIRRRFIETRYRLMPYLYTLAETSAQSGLPMLRPLFLDYPDATLDKHPIDIDPGVDAEFLLGHDLLIAPSPYPEAADAYSVEFPSAGWYDFWTGIKVPQPPPPTPVLGAPPAAQAKIALSTEVHPTLETLPVYVRAGAIIPMAPLVQSTDETPQGPLNLKVYAPVGAGDDCRGSLYTDDGSSFAYKRGEFLRMHFTCNVSANAMQVNLSAHEGSFVPWWKEVRIEVYGWKPAHNAMVDVNGRAQATSIEPGENSFAVTLPETGQAIAMTLH